MIRQSPQFYCPVQPGASYIPSIVGARACPLPGSSFFFPSLERSSSLGAVPPQGFRVGLHGGRPCKWRALLNLRLKASRANPRTYVPNTHSKQNSWPRLYPFCKSVHPRDQLHNAIWTSPPLPYRPTPGKHWKSPQKGDHSDSPFSCNRVSLAEKLLHPGRYSGASRSRRQIAVGTWRRKIMVPCQMSPVGYSKPLLGALRIVSGHRSKNR